MPTVHHHQSTIWFPASAFLRSAFWPGRVVDVDMPSDRPQWNLSHLTSYSAFPIIAALFSLQDWVICQSFVCVHIFTQFSPFIHSAMILLWVISVLWLIQYSVSPKIVNWIALKVWPVRQEEFMILEFYLCLKVSCFISVWLAFTLFNFHFVCECVCVFYNPWGVSPCHQILDSEQHAFEAGTTSVKLIVPLHLRPALFFWGNNL